MNQKKIHPAWIMFALCCVIQFSGGGILSGSFAIFTPVVCQDMGWAVAEYSFHLSLTSYVMAAMLPFVGKWIPKMTPIRLAIIGSLGAISMCVSWSFTELWQWYAAGIARGISGSFLYLSMIPIVLRKWFHKRQGTVIGICLAGSNLGGAAMSQVGQWLIDAFGWRTSITVLGFICLLTVVPCLLMLRISPEPMDIRPYGYDPADGAKVLSVRKSTGYGFIRNPLFYILAIITCCLAIPLTVAAQFSHYAVSIGSGAQVGAQLVSLTLVGGVFWKIAHGNISDRLRGQKTQLLGIVMEVIGLILVWKGGSALMMLLGSALYANVYGLTSVLLSVLVSEILPADQYDTGYPTILVFLSLSRGTAVYLFGLLFDATGSYDLCFIISIAAQALVILLAAICYAWKKRQASLAVQTASL